MHQGQEKFLGFILERVQEGKVDEAKSLLAESFKKLKRLCNNLLKI